MGSGFYFFLALRCFQCLQFDNASVGEGIDQATEKREGRGVWGETLGRWFPPSRPARPTLGEPAAPGSPRPPPSLFSVRAGSALQMLPWWKRATGNCGVGRGGSERAFRNSCLGWKTCPKVLLEPESLENAAERRREKVETTGSGAKETSITSQPICRPLSGASEDWGVASSTRVSRPGLSSWRPSGAGGLGIPIVCRASTTPIRTVLRQSVTRPPRQESGFSFGLTGTCRGAVLVRGDRVRR